MTHACDACSGSGIGSGMRCPCHNVLSTACPVCLGEGRISDRMPARDAVADAETLRRFCDDNLYSADFPLFSSYPLIAIWKCGSSGWTVRSINRGREFDARSRAETQARAAFRAVPGLRG